MLNSVRQSDVDIGAGNCFPMLIGRLRSGTAVAVGRLACFAFALAVLVLAPWVATRAAAAASGSVTRARRLSRPRAAPRERAKPASCALLPAGTDIDPLTVHRSSHKKAISQIITDRLASTRAQENLVHHCHQRPYSLRGCGGGDTARYFCSYVAVIEPRASVWPSRLNMRNDGVAPGSTSSRSTSSACTMNVYRCGP